MLRRYSLFCLLTAVLVSQNSLAKIIHSASFPPQQITINLADSDLKVEFGEKFLIEVKEEITGSLKSKADQQKLIEKFDVKYDASSGTLDIKTPKIIVGRANAMVKITINQATSLVVQGQDGDIDLKHISLNHCRIDLQDGDVLVNKVQFFSPSFITTLDGDIQLHHPIGARQILASTNGTLSVDPNWQGPEKYSLLQLQSRDGDIKVYY